MTVTFKSNVVPIRPIAIPPAGPVGTASFLPRGDKSGYRSLNHAMTAVEDHVPAQHRSAIWDALNDLSPTLTPEQRIGLAIVLDEIHEALGPV